MPRKRTPQYIKPVTVAHPSLTSSNRAPLSQQHAAASADGEKSVNDLIQHLRRSQISAKHPEPSPNSIATHTVHPSLNAILDIPQTPAPRLRPGTRPRRARGPAGPPPPESWTRPSRRASTPTHRDLGRGVNQRMDQRLGETLPGLRLPTKGSLLHLALKGIAINWNSFEEDDLCHMATLEVRHKESLLSYIACYNPQSLDCNSIHVLFLDDTEIADGTGGDGLTHIDLTSCLGHGLKAGGLKKLFLKESNRTSAAIPAAADVPESWDSQSTTTTLTTPIPQPRFPALTHLSLAHPASASWKYLLAASLHLATLTHLSLAHWPIPSLTPNSKTAYRDSPLGKIDYGGSNFYSDFDGDLSEAASILRRLSKATYCLQWFDVTGCSWTRALCLKVEDPKTDKVEFYGPDWAGAWRGVETVKAGHDWLPSCLEEEGYQWHLAISPPPSGVSSDREELIKWAKVENSVKDVEKDVRAMTKYGSSGDASNECRSRAVRFERAWNGWWIEDALACIAGAVD